MQAVRFHRAIAILALAYCLIETAYVPRLPVVMDEFDGAYEACRLRDTLPYRDYQPYKKVVGYFIEAAPALLRTSVRNRVIAIKIELVLINTAMLFAAGLCLRRRARPEAVAGPLGCSLSAAHFLNGRASFASTCSQAGPDCGRFCF